MAKVTGLTAARMMEIEAASVVDGDVVSDNLIFTKHDGTTIIAGNVRGPIGPPGGNSPGDNISIGRINARPIHSSDYTSLAAAVLDAGGVNGPQVIVGRGTHNVDQLVLPTASSTQTVGLKGEGYIVSKIKQTVDRGADTFAVKSAALTSTQQCVIEDLSIVGPNETPLVKGAGVAPAAMEGIRLAGRMSLINCGIRYFYAGARISRDHIYIRDCVIGSQNFYGLRFKDAVTAGDIQIINSDLSGAAMASWGLHPTGFVAGVTVVGGHMGFAPYFIHAEAGWTGAQAIQAVLFDRVSFERAGNGAFYDESNVVPWRQFCFRDCGDFNLNDSEWIPARGRPALFRCGSIEGWDTRGITSSCGSLGGSYADVMYLAGTATSGAIYGCHWEVDLARWFGYYAAAGKPLLRRPTFPYAGQREMGRVSGLHRGVVKETYQVGVSKGRICQSRTQNLCEHAVAGSGMDLLGVVYADVTAGDGAILLQEGGRVPVFCAQNIGVTGGAGHQRVCVDATDPSKAGATASQAAQPVIGQHWHDVFTAAPGLADVDLRMPRG